MAQPAARSQAIARLRDRIAVGGCPRWATYRTGVSFIRRGEPLGPHLACQHHAADRPLQGGPVQPRDEQVWRQQVLRGLPDAFRVGPWKARPPQEREGPHGERVAPAIGERHLRIGKIVARVVTPMRFGVLELQPQLKRQVLHYASALLLKHLRAQSTPVRAIDAAKGQAVLAQPFGLNVR